MRKLKSLDRNQVISIQTPIETNTYQPVSYQSLIFGADKLANEYQFVLQKEEFQTDVHGGKVKMKFFYDDGISKDGFQLSVLTSHDKSLSVRAAGGVFSYICWNLNMVGDIVLLHRHQGDVQDEVDTFLKSCFSSHQSNIQAAEQMKDNFSSIALTKREIAELVGRAYVEEKLISISHVSNISKELANPSFDYGHDSLWSLYNHFTHSIKNEHPLNYLQTQTNVQNFFQNLQLELS